ncbi:diacylglycerol kinase catalytic domain protein [Fulvivirga imtechensis AK7]|uniref:Diacylglycerol kinase catalytic domain protein n=1 Tax=Fulvivirga imtechensis AK7 TaxID=1237149 RepID=L8JLX9_9BACT|nr:YegS/Rv2252/BmrU family lipid kinase [Fulvivirga imtechensis]ELR69800.1 diacylglycerol kinase catalytic domain protein [Fulvivirga imtechensis AK7]
MNKILFVINPISGGRDKTGLHQEIYSFCKNNHLQGEIMETTGKNDFDRIHKKMEQVAPDTVVACGGDGTINMVAQALLKKSITLGIIPLGSANGLAAELLIPRDIKKALDIIKENNVLPIDIVQINGKYISLHLSDVGFNAKLIKHFDQGRVRGKLGYLTHFFKTLHKKSPRRYTFNLKGNKFRRRAEMVVFANASRYGTGAVVNPEGIINDGKFEVCIFKPYPWYAIFRLTFDFFTGRMKKSPYVKIFSTTEITVKAHKAVPLQIDGEVIGDFKTVYVKMLQKQLPVIVSPYFKIT